MERQITIRHNQEEMTATIHYPAAEGSEKTGRCSRIPLVVICHGFVGSRIGVDRLFVKTARQLSAEGYMVIRFDYIGCGESSGSYGSEGLESMIAQTRSVLDYGVSCADVDPTRVTLIGHSLGGAVAIHTAVRDRRVKNLVLWAAVGYPFNDIVKITGRDVYDTSVKEGKADYLGYELTPVFFESLATVQPFQEAVRFAGMCWSFTGRRMKSFRSTTHFCTRRYSGCGRRAGAIKRSSSRATIHSRRARSGSSFSTARQRG